VGSRSPAPRPTASNAPTRVPAGPATEVRPAPGKGKGKGRNRSWSATTSRMWVAPRPGDTTRRRECPPSEAAKRRGPGHGCSSAVTAPSWGSRPPSARRRRRRRGRAAPRLHHLRCNAGSHKRGRRRRGGLLHCNRLHRRRQRLSVQRRRHHHHRSQGHRPRPRLQGRPRWEGPTRGPWSLRWERRTPRSLGEIGCGLTSSKQPSEAFLCSI
jgi:hypothetical protein